MGWFVRASAVCSTLVFGCASIAGLDDSNGGEPSRDETKLEDKPTASTPLPPSSSSSSSSGSTSSSSSSSSSGSSGSSGTDASSPVDAGPDTASPQCTKQPLGGTCSGNNDCCSGACANTSKCSNGCRGFFSSCGGDTPCCLGLVCRSFLCQNP